MSDRIESFNHHHSAQSGSLIIAWHPTVAFVSSHGIPLVIYVCLCYDGSCLFVWDSSQVAGDWGVGRRAHVL